MSEEIKVDEFIHLHVHSMHSFLDGIPTCEQIANRAKELGQPAIAITDHGYMFANYKHQVACNEAGIKAIHGVESYYVDDVKQKERHMYHLVLLAMNEQGWKNLIKLNSDAGKYGFYYKPRIDCKMLEKYHEGLIVLSGCYKSPISYHLNVEGMDVDRAVSNMRYFKNLLGDRFYNEVMQIGMPEYDDIVPSIIDMADREGVRTVCTNDCHYTKREESVVQDVLLRINTGNKGLTIESDQLYIKTREEMVVGPITQEMADTTLEITDRIKFKLEFEGYKFPSFNISESEDYEDFAKWIKGRGNV